MAQTVDIYGGSYFQAASLPAQFNAVAESAKVSLVLHDAVDLLTSAVTPLLAGFDLKKRETYPYIGYRTTTLLSTATLAQIATTALPGDGAGKVAVAIRESTEKKLQNLCKIFGLASMADTARLAVAVYADVAKSNSYGEVFLERGQETKRLDVKRPAP